MDPRSVARSLVDEITAAVHRRYQPKNGVLVPPKLSGRFAVRSLADGDKIVELADELLEVACEDWPPGLDEEVFLDLLQVDKAWVVEWVVDTTKDESVPDM